MPWRRSRRPYPILVSEIMLQQTQVERVEPKWRAFLKAFPSLNRLAQAPRRDVIVLWDGLGYNLRAVRLHLLAQRISRERHGRLPRTLEELRALPGVGPYTASALACFAFGVDTPVVDTNIERVLRRLFAADPSDPDAPITKRRGATLAAALLPAGRSRDWNLALMDLGAQVCAPRQPRCGACPLAAWCTARAAFAAPRRQAGSQPRSPSTPGGPRRLSRRPAVRFENSNRYYRGRIVKLLRSLAPHESVPLSQLGRRIKADFTVADRAWLGKELRKMAREGLLEVRRKNGRSHVAMPS
ncbi:MAG: A/G-specific adenine glycosylase [Candidatus Tectomicrobia bacterium]|nr:A/G-specific adenine glycosylase [Candidatus Tectomicrobia bacterium]